MKVAQLETAVERLAWQILAEARRLDDYPRFVSLQGLKWRLNVLQLQVFMRFRSALESKPPRLQSIEYRISKQALDTALVKIQQLEAGRHRGRFMYSIHKAKVWTCLELIYLWHVLFCAMEIYAIHM